MAEHLPPNNPAERELFGRWGEDLFMMHDISSSLRNLLVQNYNLHRGDAPAEEAVHLSYPGKDETKADTWEDPIVVQAERDHLQMVLNRSDPH